MECLLASCLAMTISVGHGGRSNAFTGTEDTCYFFDMQLPNPRASGLLAQSKAQAKGADYATSVAAGEIVKQKAAAAAKDILLGPGGALQRFSGGSPFE